MSQTPAFVTLFSGDDTISRDREKGLLVERIFALHEKQGVEEQLFDSDQQDLTHFLERIITPSLFQSIRIFSLRHVDGFSADNFAMLAQVIRHPVPDVYVIIEADGGGKKSKPFLAWVAEYKKLLKKDGSHYAHHELAKPPEYKIADWLVSNCPLLFKRKITKREADYFIDLVGTDFDTLYTELQKLDIYLPEGAAIDKKAIVEVVEGSREMNSFELAQALGRKDLNRALEIIDSLFSVSFYAPPCVSAIFRHFWALFRIAQFRERFPGKVESFIRTLGGYNRTEQSELGLEIGIAAGLLTPEQAPRVYPAVIKSGVVQQSASFSIASFPRIFELLRDYDIGIKTGRVEPAKGPFQLLCYKLVRADELGAAVLESAA
jgi:DNA polymerase-3 subunit delta